MKTWEEQRQATLQHWQRVLSMMADEDLEAVVRQVTRTTDFCAEADELLKDVSAENRCQLCAHAARYGSCLGMTHAVLEQIGANRWDRAGQEVQQIIAHFEAIR